MGRKKNATSITTSNPTFDLMYGEKQGDDLELDHMRERAAEFSATNPQYYNAQESFHFDDMDGDYLNDDAEEIPEGINIPGNGRGGKSLGRLKRNQSLTKKKKKDRNSARRASKRGRRMLETHELLGLTREKLEQDGHLEEYEEEELDDKLRKSAGGWRERLSMKLSGLGGGAMSSVVLGFLGVPALVISLLPQVSYALFGQFLFIPFLFYIYLSLPVFFGWIFSFLMRTLGPLNGYKFEVGSLSIFPWIKDYKIHIRVVVQNFAFGNPPGFPFEDFVSARRVDIEGCIHFRHILNLITLRKEAVPLQHVPDFERYMLIDFDHVEADGVMCNFQMYDGEFNINKFTRIIADGEVKAVIKKDPFPNQLSVRIISAKYLQPHRLKKTCDPYVVVRCRRQEYKTHTQNQTVNPMWNETLKFHVDDASVVIEVCVYDRDAVEGNQAHLIGHWAMTTKYLVTDPSYNWHYDEEFKTYTKRRPKKGDGSTGFEGWVPLATKKWKKMGLCGQLKLEILWKNVPDHKIENKYVPARKYTALEQLSMQSAEDQLRLGDWARLRKWLSHEPFCYDIRRFTVRDTKFYVQDLFRGTKGKAEALLVTNSDAGGANAVKLPFLEMTKQFRPKNGDEGITSYDAFEGFFVGLLTSFARSGKLGSAVAQILAAEMFNFGNTFTHILRGEFEKALPIKPKHIKEVTQLAKSGFAVLHQNVTQTRRNRKQFKIAVDADDIDFLMDQVELSGHLDRCALKMTREINNAGMAQLARKRGNFKTKYFELKGDTLFFRKHKVVPKGVTYNLTYKTRLDCVYSAVYVKSMNELLLNVQDENHVVRLRDANPNFEDVDKKKNPKLLKWIKVIVAHDIPYEEFD